MDKQLANNEFNVKEIKKVAQKILDKLNEKTEPLETKLSSSNNDNEGNDLDEKI